MIHLGLTTAVSTTDAVIQKKLFGSGTTALIFSNKVLNDLMKIVKFLEDAGLLMQYEGKEQKGGFLGILAATLASSLLGSMLSDKGVIHAGEGTNIAVQDF